METHNKCLADSSSLFFTAGLEPEPEPEPEQEPEPEPDTTPTDGDSKIDQASGEEDKPLGPDGMSQLLV